MTSTLVLAGDGTGAGKTTLAAGLARALERRGWDVQPFKAGPDFIDADVLERAAGAPCYTLDPWMMGEEGVERTWAGRSGEADVALVDGVMGLFDGLDETPRGSTAHVARLVDAPVVPVIDVEAVSGTAAALAHGLATLDPRLDVPGFLLNRAGSATHAEWVQAAVERATGRPVFGVLPRDEQLERPERHLGLVTIGEDEDPDAYLDRLADAVEEHVRVGPLLEATAGRPASAPETQRDRPAGTVRVGVADDACFSFYYRANLDRLQRLGAEIVPFSPIHDDELPAVDGLYLGGGYPELFADQLASNQSMRGEVRRRAEGGLPVLAECGGLLYLTRQLEDGEGSSHPMCGLLDAEGVWGSQLTIGYVEARAEEPTPLTPAGATVRGHEFHRTELAGLGRDLSLSYDLERGRGIEEGRDGWQVADTLASYTHHHFAAASPERFVERCRAGPGPAPEPGGERT